MPIQVLFANLTLPKAGGMSRFLGFRYPSGILKSGTHSNDEAIPSDRYFYLHPAGAGFGKNTWNGTSLEVVLQEEATWVRLPEFPFERISDDLARFIHFSIDSSVQRSRHSTDGKPVS